MGYLSVIFSLITLETGIDSKALENYVSVLQSKNHSAIQWNNLTGDKMSREVTNTSFISNLIWQVSAYYVASLLIEFQGLKCFHWKCSIQVMDTLTRKSVLFILQTEDQGPPNRSENRNLQETVLPPEGWLCIHWGEQIPSTNLMGCNSTPLALSSWKTCLQSYLES